MQGRMVRTGQAYWMVGVIAAVMLAFAFGSIALAEQGQYDKRDGYDQRDRYHQQSMGRTGETKHHSASKLIGMEVFSEGGEEIGNIENIVLNENRDKVEYIVVAEGGFLGFTADLHAVPWTWMTPRPEENRVIVPLDARSFEDKEGFSEYPTLALDQEVLSWRSPSDWHDMRFRGEQEYGYRDGYRDRDMGTDRLKRHQMRKVTALIGMDVKLAQSRYGDEYSMYDDGYYHNGGTTDYPSGMGEDYYEAFGDEAGARNAAGEIDDILLSSDGAVSFAVIEPERDFFEDIDFTSEDVIAVPWARIYVHPVAELAVANLTKREVGQLTIAEDQLNRFDDPNFVSDFFSRIGLDYDMYVQDVTTERRFNGDRYRGRMDDGRYRDERYRSNGDRYDDRYDRRYREDDRYREDRYREDRYREDRYRDERYREDRTRQDRRSQMNQFRHWSNFTNQCLGQDLKTANRTLTGTIRNTGTLYTDPRAEAPDGKRFTVTTRNNERVTVYVGPDRMVSQPVRLSRGEQVTFRGTECRVDGKQVFVPTRIETDEQNWVLEEQRGLPQWVPEERRMQREEFRGRER